MFSLNVFSLILALGASFGLFRIAMASRPSQRTTWLLAGLLTLTGALIGARLGYVLLHINYFSLHPGQMALFWLGGLTWEGALGGGLLTLLAVKKIWQWSFFSLLDKLSLMLLPLGVAGWLACWASGTAYGQTLPSEVWWGIHTLDETGLSALRTPVQPLAAISLVAFMGFTELLLLQNTTTGWKGTLAGLIFSADMLLFTFLRADPAERWLGLRFESWSAMVYTLLGVAALFFILVRDGKIKLDLKSKFDAIIAFIKRIVARMRKSHETEAGTGTN